MNRRRLVKPSGWPTKREMRITWQDVRSWIGGWCNACPFDAVSRPHIADAHIADAHIRCLERAYHDGPHRFNNVVWVTGGDPEHFPLRPAPGPRLRNRAAYENVRQPSWRQRRQYDRFLSSVIARRAARRRMFELYGPDAP